jgi:hypothetical protein
MQSSFDGTRPQGPWFQHLVLRLDERLRHWYNILEYSRNPQCVFRIGMAEGTEDLCLSDGTRLHRGDPIIDLHLWNEHVPPFGPSGPSLAWARQMKCCVDVSLRELAAHLSQHDEYDDVHVIRANMVLGPAAQGAQLARIVEHLGFEPLGEQMEPIPVLERLNRAGVNILAFLLVLATNPQAARADVLLRHPIVAHISRRHLQRRYGAPRPRSRPVDRREALPMHSSGG